MKYGIIFIVLLLITGAAQAGQRLTMTTSVAEDLADSPDARILRAVASLLDLDIRFRLAPFKRRLIMLETGDVDLVCGLLKRPEREAYIHFVTPPYKTRSDTIFFVPKGGASRIQTYEDLKGLKIGITRGAKYFEPFDRDPGLIKETALTLGNVRKLLLGRLDTVIIDEANGLFILHQMAASDQIDMAVYRFSQEKRVYLGISKQSWMMAALGQIEPVLRQMILSGQVRAIIEDYYFSQGLPVPAM